MKKHSKVIYYITIIILLLAFLLPFIPLFINSLAYDFRWPRIIPSNVTWRAFKYVFYENPNTYEAIFNTLIIATSVVVIDILIAVPAAFSLVRYEFKGKFIIKVILFAPIIIPSFTAIMGMYVVFIKLGLTESIYGVILAHILPTLPYMIKALMVSYGTLDSSLEHQAAVLGAGPISRFIYISLPHILPGMVAGAGLTFLISISQYFLTFLVGGGKVITISIIMFPFISGGDNAIGSVYGVLFSSLAIINLVLIDFVLKKYYKMRNFKII
ncbi:ABC transporter permease subunit [Clostridium estertheticum]|uniref:ABC transporter permease n=1 Tax=Clostridium estertheticum TaxID=238834 RepID=UPI0013E97466|nr:ABC transporter permease subunit [Clostridium estertheticum]MBZ9685013.1 ABC transporter permease subunit [Clostridium estertheticum]